MPCPHAPGYPDFLLRRLSGNRDLSPEILLEAGVATRDTTHNCGGGISLGSHEFRCWNKKGHGSVDLHPALKESCDVWFYRVGLQLGIDRLSAMSHKLGLGQPTGFPFGNERGGMIPDRDWKKKRFGSAWYDGETVICSIGQGYVLTTPLQLAPMTAAVANGGWLVQPHFVHHVDGEAPVEYPTYCHSNNCS